MAHAKGDKQLFEDALVPVPSLNLWAANNLQVSYGDQVEFLQRPAFIYNETSQICFEIPASMTNFTSPELYLNCEIKVSEIDTTTLAEKGIAENDQNFTLSSFPLHSLFSDVEFRVNNLTLTTKSSLYPYLAYFHETHLTPKDEIVFKEGTALGYHFKQSTLSLTKGTGQAAIRAAICDGNHLLLRDKLHIPLLEQDKAILNNCTLTIILHQTSNEFRIIDKTQARKVKVTINDIFLTGKRQILFDGLYMKMMNKLKASQAIYPIKRFLVEQVQMPPGATTISKNLSLTTSAVPDYLFLMYVSTEAVAGSKSMSPFDSNISKICRAQINFEGRNFPAHPYDASDSKDLVRIYSDYKIACKNISNKPNQFNAVSFEDFRNDYGIMAFQLARYGGSSKDMMDENMVSLPRAGVAVLNLQLTSAETSSKTFILISFYRNKIFFNESMIPSTDFTS